MPRASFKIVIIINAITVFNILTPFELDLTSAIFSFSYKVGIYLLFNDKRTRVQENYEPPESRSFVYVGVPLPLTSNSLRHIITNW